MLYLGLTIEPLMKQILIAFALVVTLISCSKNEALLPAAKPTQKFYSRVQYFKDHRTPATDTVWTLTLTSPALVQQYTSQDGYIYNETSTFVDKGVLWTR